MKDFKTWFQENYNHNSGLEPSEKLCKVVDEYAKEYAKETAHDLSDNKDILQAAREIFYSK